MKRAPCRRKDCLEADRIIAKQRVLLTGTTAIVRGPPPPLTHWGHHDLPERVAEIVKERDELVTALARIVLDWTLDGVVHSEQIYSALERHRSRRAEKRAK